MYLGAVRLNFTVKHVHFKDETEPDQVPLTLVSLSCYMTHVAEHTLIGSFQLYPDYQEIENLKIHQFVVE